MRSGTKALGLYASPGKFTVVALLLAARDRGVMASFFIDLMFMNAYGYIFGCL